MFDECKSYCDTLLLLLHDDPSIERPEKIKPILIVNERIMILNSLKGMLVLTPRNMVQASGMYNTLMSCTDPALIIEPLNAYRLKEKEPLNLGEFTVPLGKIEIINPGTDITVVSYGSTLKLVEKTIPELERNNINIELIDIQSLIPFDLNKDLVESIKKTNKLLIVDEDYPGGASSFILKVLMLLIILGCFVYLVKDMIFLRLLEVMVS